MPGVTNLINIARRLEMLIPRSLRSIRIIALLLIAGLTIATSNLPAVAAKPEVSQVGDTLYIDGHGTADHVSIIGSNIDVGTVGVYVSDVPWVYTGVENIVIDMSGGDDVLGMDRIRIDGDLSVELGGGKNDFWLGGWGYGLSQIGGNVQIYAVDGVEDDDLITIDDVHVAGSLMMSTGDGDDSVFIGFTASDAISISGTVFESGLTISTGSDDDSVRIQETVAGWMTYVNTGTGNDTVKMIPPLLVGRAAAPDSRNSRTGQTERRNPAPHPENLVQDQERRQVFPATNGFENLTILTMIGEDSVTLAGNVVAGETVIELDDDDDSLGLTMNSFNGDFDAHGGSGDDYLEGSDDNEYNSDVSFHSF